MWWDVRPHPNLGTVEIRVCDAQTRLEHTVALAALIQAMCKELAESYESGYQLGTFPREVLEENKWLAARYGLDGTLIDLPQPARVGAADLARRLAGPPSAPCAGAGLRAGVRGDRGDDRERHRRAPPARRVAGSRDLKELVRRIVDATAAGVRGRAPGS